MHHLCYRGRLREVGTFSGIINSQSMSDALGRLESALSQLQGLSVRVELDRAGNDFDASFSAALGSRGQKQGRSRAQDTDTITVKHVSSDLGPLEPWGHATISIDGETAVGLEPDSGAAAFFGLAEDLATSLPSYVAGHIQQDYRIPEAKAVIHITVNQARVARAFIRQAEENPQLYDFLYQNCAQWVEEVLAATGIDTPNEETPGDLVDYLKQRFPQ